MIRAIAKRLLGEEGSVLLFVAIATPVLCAAFAIAVDVGDWFVHQRTLQHQVDAAAFAGSDRWGVCFDSGATVGFSAMQTEANKYAGEGTLNPQVGGTLKGQLQPLAFNSSTFPPTAPTNFASDLDLPANPCIPRPSDKKYIFDVKGTENHVPLILGGFFPSLTGPNVHALARLELQQVLSLNPSMPLAVPDVNPRSVSITLVDTKPNPAIPLATCTSATYTKFPTCAFSRTATDSPAIVAGAGTKTWTFSGINATIPAGDQNFVVVRVGLGSAAQDCPAGSTGGATWVCVDAGDPPVNAVVPTPAFAAGAKTYSIGVELQGNFQVYTPCSGAGTGGGYTCATDPAVKLRFASTAGSHTFSIDCGTLPGGTGGDFYQQLRNGCANPFQVNAADLCPDTVTDPPDCAPVNNAVGDKLGQLRQAMNDRFAGSGCAPNNYPTTSGSGDGRVVILIVTDFSAFFGNGGGTEVPVVTYAAFYVTGWDGAPNSCNNEPYPVDPADPNGKPHGDVWGHFINYVTSATASGTPCAFAVGSLSTPCTPSLVR
jgi:hypothetical protein